MTIDHARTQVADARRRLRLVDDPRAGSAAGQDVGGPQPPGPRAAREPAGYDRVVVAGADASARGRMLAELRSLLPPGTRFVQARETWELVARAADSDMVVLAGAIGDVCTDSLLRLLARRNPSLPVLAVGDDRRPDAPAEQRSRGRERRAVGDAARA